LAKLSATARQPVPGAATKRLRFTDQGELIE
jgi:hypothetical protein